MPSSGLNRRHHLPNSCILHSHLPKPHWHILHFRLPNLVVATSCGDWGPVEVVAETAVEIVVIAVVKTSCHTTLYNGPLQRQTGGPRCTISFNNTILFTILSSSPINTVFWKRDFAKISGNPGTSIHSEQLRIWLLHTGILKTVVLAPTITPAIAWPIALSIVELVPWKS